MFKTIFLSTTKFKRHKKYLGVTAHKCPRVRGPGQSSIGGLHVCAGGMTF